MRRLQIIGVVCLAALGTLGVSKLTSKKPVPETTISVRRDVTALGRLTPKGGLVKLAVPAGLSGGNQIVTKWMVTEGQNISKGQILAQLSSYRQLKTSILNAEETLRLSNSILPFLETSSSKALELYKRGSISKEELAKANAALITKKSEILTNTTALRRAKDDLESSILRSPLDGKLIKIYSWPGMSQTDDGLALAGETQNMQVWAQVYQTDINQIYIGQKANITAESGGFKGELAATVKSIIGQVSEKDLFAASGSNEVNARVLLVKLELNNEGRRKVELLSGLNVTVSFEKQ